MFHRFHVTQVSKTSREINMAVWSTFLRSSALNNVQLLKSLKAPIASKVTQNGKLLHVLSNKLVILIGRFQ